MLSSSRTLSTTSSIVRHPDFATASIARSEKSGSFLRLKSLSQTMPKANESAPADTSARSMAASPRIGAWLELTEYEAFSRYANGLHLDSGIVAGLLILRLVNKNDPPDFSQKALPPIVMRTRLTASLRSASGRKAFRTIVQRCGVRPETVLRHIVRWEIEDRWVEKMLWNQIDSSMGGR